MSASNNKYFTRKLLEWNRLQNRRQMPWKGEKDPYKVWISEVILQQTRVEQGLEYYNKFIIDFPNVRALVSAPQEKVYKRWEGLGYYSRCNNLLKAAYIIVNEHDGIFPNQYESIIALPGIGPYTAAAIASFVFNQKKAVVDGNVYRVLSRFFGNHQPIDTGQGKKEFEQLAQQLLSPQFPGIYNQAIMDFGATVCKPKPDCNACPLASHCIANLQGIAHQLPVKLKRTEKKERNIYFFIVKKRGKCLLRKRVSDDIWKNLHEFPSIETKDWLEPVSVARKYFLQRDVKIASVSKLYQQQLTHRMIKAKFIVIKDGILTLPEGFKWVGIRQLKALAFPKIINQFFEEETPFG